MSQTHLLSDALARIRNAQLVGNKEVLLFYSKLVESVISILVNEYYVEKFEKFEERKGVYMLKVFLKYVPLDDSPVIKELKIVSKPGKRVYRSCSNIEPVYGGLGVVILSTSKGVIVDADAKKNGVGGEVLCSVF